MLNPRATIAAAGDLTTLHSGVPFVSWAEVVVNDRKRNREGVLVPTGPLVALRIEVEEGRPVLTAVSVRREPGGRPLSATYVHELALDALVNEAITAVASEVYAGAFRLGPGGGIPAWDPFEHDAAVAGALKARIRRPVTDELLREVVRIAEENPGEVRTAVGRELGASERTVSRWLAEARRRRLLPALEGEARGPRRPRKRGAAL